jgi:CheY-like chemotaxis protein
LTTTVPPGTPRLLVVDDDPANVILLQRTLARLGSVEVIGITDPAGAAQT